MKRIYNTIFAYLLFVIVIAIPPVILQQIKVNNLLINDFWVLFSFMSFLTLVVLFTLLIVNEKSPDFFTQAFLGATTVKFLVSIIFIFAIRKNQDKAIFIGDFMYIYFLNTIFEIYLLLFNLRHKNSR